MGDQSAIQWTDATWNPVTGCSKVSPGCAHCYAERVAIRLWPKQYPPIPLVGAYVDDAGPASRPRRFTDVQCHDDRRDQPLRWKKPRKVFVNSMSDLFHEDVPDTFILSVFTTMEKTQRHTFQILTKRAARMLEVVEWVGRKFRDVGDQWPLPNVWLGVSCENQRFADERIPLLLQTPAAVRFISAEPLLGPVDLEAYLPSPKWHKHEQPMDAPLSWVIVGGESGRGARPFDIAWARRIVAQCQYFKTPVFVKQLGAAPIVPAGRLRHWEWGGEIGREARFEATDPLHESSAPWRVVLRDRAGGDIAEWPEDLRVRQMPEARG